MLLGIATAAIAASAAAPDLKTLGALALVMGLTSVVIQMSAGDGKARAGPPPPSPPSGCSAGSPRAATNEGKNIFSPNVPCRLVTGTFGLRVF
jgi:hypothetical protein